MALEFKLPDVGEGLREAELIKWLVEEGEQVAEDQPLMEVQTDKATVEISSPYSARIAELKGKPGDTLHVHSVVVVFDDDQSDSAPDEGMVEGKAESGPQGSDEPDQERNGQSGSGGQPVEAKEVAAGTADDPSTEHDDQSDAADRDIAQEENGATASGSGRRALAAPATRRKAREMGIDINQVHGTGPAGRVTPDDLKRFAEGDQAAAPGSGQADGHESDQLYDRAASGRDYGTDRADERIPIKGIRKVIAQRMVTSKQTAPHVTTVDEVDMTELVAFRERAKERAADRGIKLSYLPFIIKAVITALKEYPYLNARIDDEKQEIILRKEYHIGFALDTDAGLLVPVIHDADRKPIFQIAAEMQGLIEKGRAGKLQPDQMRGSTFTLSNQGSVGGLFFTPVINHPEVAILGIGQTQERPVVRDGQIAIRKMAYLALSFDHRLIDGAVATRFMNRVVELLGDPTLLMMEGM